MDSIINKLTEIEDAASAIVAHAEDQKTALDNEDSFNEYDLIVQKINSAKKFKTTNNSELTKAQNELKDLKEHIYSLKTKSCISSA